MADPIYNIWIRTLDPTPGNEKLKRIALVTVYSKLEFKIMYNNVGGWTLTMPGDIEEANLLKSLLIGTPDQPTNSGRGFGGILVTRNGNIVFSGPVRGFNETGDYTGPSGKEIEFYGVDDTGYLASRIPMAPAPAVAGNAPSSTGVPFIPGSTTTRYLVAPFFKNWAYFVFGSATRTVTQVMRNLVRTNLGDAAPFNIGSGFANRGIPFLDVQDRVFGPKNFKSRSRYSGTVLEKVQDAAAYVDGNYQGPYTGPYRGVAFRIMHTTDDRLEFQMWDPRDPNHNRGVVFSADRGNLGSYKYNHQAPNVNFAVVGGQADDNNAERTGTSRWFEHKGVDEIGPANPNSVRRFGLWEGYIDRRDIQYPTPIINNPPNANFTDMKQELVDAMNVFLTEQGEQINIEITTLNVPSSIWSVDYNVGDLVKVVIDDYQYDQVVRDVTVRLTKNEGEVVVPTIGTEVTGQSIRLFNKINEIDTSINSLNSSQ